MIHIETEAQYWAIRNRIEELLPLVSEETPLDDKNFVELDLLSGLVEEYDEIHFPIKEPSLSDVLKLKMYELGLTQKQLADLVGISAARMSEIISGKRNPTFSTAREISSKLSIDPGVVLGV